MNGEERNADRPGRRPVLGPEVFAELRSAIAIPVLVVGVGGGLIGAAYLAAVDLLRRVIGPDGHSVAVQTGILAATGLVVVVGTRLLGPSGNVELLVDNIHLSGGTDDVRSLRSLIPTSIVCIAAGGPMGAEAPLVQTCGTFGGWLSTKRELDADDMRILTITAMAAGFAVLFGAPLGAALFALEILHKRGLQYYEALVPSLIGALAGYAVYIGLTGMGIEPLWRLPDIGALQVTDLGWGLVCGGLGAAGAIAFTIAATLARRLAEWLPAPALPIIGGLLLGGLFAWSPFALTNGEGQVDAITASAMTAGALGVIIVVKFAGVVVALASRWKGGFIIPLFFLGIVGGQLLHLAVPSTNVTVLMAALAAALCVGVTKTPLGSTLAVTQMAGLPLLPMTLIAALASLLLTSGTTMIETQRERAQPPGRP
jgi:H+/Cl- antiporter ClcA